MKWDNVWLRVIGDFIFAIGALVLTWFIFGLKFGWSLNEDQPDNAKAEESHIGK